MCSDEFFLKYALVVTKDAICLKFKVLFLAIKTLLACHHLKQLNNGLANNSNTI